MMRTLTASPRRMGAWAGVREISLAGWLYSLLVAGATAYLVSFVAAATFRLTYPFPLDVTEGLVLREVQGILDGKPIYVAPTFDHVPLIYGPVYFYMSALVAKVVGPGFSALRVVSLAASLGTLGLVGWIVHRETKNLTASVAAIGLLAATYPLSQTVADVGRVDAAFVFFLVAGLYVAHAETLRSEARWPFLALSGALIGVAGLTKIPMGALPVAITLAGYLAIKVRGRAILFLVGFLAAIVLGLLALRLQTGPWATWYLLDLPSGHAAQQNLLDRFWFTDLLPRLSVPLLIGPVYLVTEASRGNRRPLLFFGLVGIGLLSLGWASRSSNGGAINVLVPAHVLVALYFGLGLHAILKYAGVSPMLNGLRTYALGVCVVQLALLAYNPRLTVPLRSDQWADERLAHGLAQLPGAIFAPNLDGYLRSSDKGEQPLTGAIDELGAAYGGTPSQEGLSWQATLQDALKQHRFSYVVLDEGSCCLHDVVLGNGYIDAGPLFGPDDDFWRWKSKRTPEEHLYAPARGGG